MTRERIRTALLGLVERPPRSNLDIRPVEGRAPWRRLRVGEMGVIFRELALVERRALRLGSPAYLVARIVDRRDLDEAVRPL
ncbi:MAG: hypothetical protein E6H84_13765 [Chloroflexi bacterium]|nr:MAG: hypothetical protein E6H84_13765 [Chloroflexota bacterium]